MDHSSKGLTLHHTIIDRKRTLDFEHKAALNNTILSDYEFSVYYIS